MPNIINGTDKNDKLDGTDDVLNPDEIHGLEGNDHLTGGLGSDSLFGDEGNDHLSDVDGGGEMHGGEGNDHLEIDWAGAHGVKLFGDAGNDHLTGGDGYDLLDGGTGDDDMAGGKGADTYVVNSADDVVTEANIGGNDTVRSSISYSLDPAANDHVFGHVENLVLTGADDLSGTGNWLNNFITGNDGANVLSGLGGKDTIKGGEGNDIVVGGAANDLLTGGAGDDTFVYAAGDSTNQIGTGRDVIYDFGNGADKLDLSAMDLHFVAGNSFHHEAGELIARVVGANVYVNADLDGNGTADFAIQINNHGALTADDFIL